MTISYVCDCYGGTASDNFIVEDGGFLKKLRPCDKIMADCGFKLHDTLAFWLINDSSIGA